MGDDAAAVIVTAAEIPACDIAAVVSDQIETLEERVEHAEQVSEIITEAAIEGERARRMNEIEEGLSECHSNLSRQSETMNQSLTEMRQWMAEQLETHRNENAVALQNLLLELTSEASTPPLLTETAEPEAIVPEEVETTLDPEPDADDRAPKKRHRFL